MSKITGSFIVLVLVIFFSSIVYIWQADAEKRTLESQIVSQKEQIADLENQLEDIESPANIINAGEIQGITTATGTLAGTVNLSQKNINEKQQAEAILVCVTETRSKQENCLDFIIEKNQQNYKYEFEVPQGTYEIYAILPPNETKVYYSEISTCDEDGDCTTNSDEKRLIEVIQEETQSNIDIYL